MKKLVLWSSALLLALSLSLAAVAQEEQKEGKAAAAAKEDRWEGVVLRSNPDNSSLTVRKVGSNQARTVLYDSSTKWVSQEHGSKNVNDIDASQVKDGDRVIARGTWEKGGAVLHATQISKRLSHSPR